MLEFRAERPGDTATIADVVRAAYADVPWSDHREHRMIARLRGTDAFVPGLSILATVDGTPAGHILLTRARIGAHETLALAPLSVMPDYRGRGVGAGLVREARDRAAALGFGSILVVGIPGYYQRLGFLPLAGFPVTLPFAAPPQNCAILPLRLGALDGVAGRVAYPPGWLAEEH